MDMGQQTAQPDFWPWRLSIKIDRDPYFLMHISQQNNEDTVPGCSYYILVSIFCHWVPAPLSKKPTLFRKHTFSHIFRKPRRWQVFKHQGSLPITMGWKKRRLIWRKRRLKYLHLTDSLKLQGFPWATLRVSEMIQLRCWLHDPNELLNPDVLVSGREAKTPRWKDPNHLT